MGQHTPFEVHRTEESENDQHQAAFWLVLAAEYRVSPREVQVAEALRKRLSRPAIAEALQCAVGTVRVYIDRLYRKMGVKDRLELLIRLTQAAQK